MGMMKHYLLTLLTTCAPEDGFLQDAIEHCINTGIVHLRYQQTADIAEILSQHDEIVATYQNFLQQELKAEMEAVMDLAA